MSNHQFINIKKSQPWMSMDLMMGQKRANKALCSINNKKKKKKNQRLDFK